jgi:hypothetical protein
MSTAIAMIYTKEGFVAASDGFGNRGKGAPSLDEQKLFDVVGYDFTLIYGISGAASLIGKDADGNETDYFKPIYSQVASELRSIGIANLEEYADLFVSKVGNKTVQEIANPDDRFADRPHTLKVQFVGYCHGIPGMAERTLTYCRSGFSVPCKITYSPPRFANRLLVGYDEVAEILSRDGDDEFRNYRTDAWKKVWRMDESISLEEAIEAAKNIFGRALQTPPSSLIGRKEKPLEVKYLWSLSHRPLNGSNPRRLPFLLRFVRQYRITLG